MVYSEVLVGILIRETVQQKMRYEVQVGDEVHLILRQWRRLIRPVNGSSPSGEKEIGGEYLTSGRSLLIERKVPRSVLFRMIENSMRKFLGGELPFLR